MEQTNNIGEERLIVGPDEPEARVPIHGLQDLAGGPQNGASMTDGAF